VTSPGPPSGRRHLPGPSARCRTPPGIAGDVELSTVPSGARRTPGISLEPRCADRCRKKEEISGAPRCGYRPTGSGAREDWNSVGVIASRTHLRLGEKAQRVPAALRGRRRTPSPADGVADRGASSSSHQTIPLCSRAATLWARERSRVPERGGQRSGWRSQLDRLFRAPRTARASPPGEDLLLVGAAAGAGPRAASPGRRTPGQRPPSRSRARPAEHPGAFPRAHRQAPHHLSEVLGARPARPARWPAPTGLPPAARAPARPARPGPARRSVSIRMRDPHRQICPLLEKAARSACEPLAQIGVGEDQRRVLPAHLQGQLLERRSGFAGDLPSHPRPSR